MMWSIPADGGYWNMIVNKSLFDKAGKSDLLPKGPDYSWTTEEFMAACKAINDPPKCLLHGFLCWQYFHEFSHKPMAGWLPRLQIL